MERIRAKRQKPGLLKQHLAAAEAAKTVGGAEVEGTALGSQTLKFRPGPVTPEITDSLSGQRGAPRSSCKPSFRLYSPPPATAR